MSQRSGSRTIVVIGIGNRYRQDDAIGLVVARRVRPDVSSDVRVNEHEGDPLDLLRLWSGVDLAVLIDALNAPDKAGTVCCFDPALDLPPAREQIVSSHGHSVWDAWDLGRLLAQQPRRLLILAVAGKRFDHGEGLSPEVEPAVDEAARCILTILADDK